MTKEKRSAHRFAGQDEGEALALWLNGKYSPQDQEQLAVRKRVGRLVQDMNTNADRFIETGTADTELAKRIDRELSRYRLWVETVHVQEAGRYKTFAEQRWFFRWSCKEGERVAAMLSVLVRLAEHGLLRRLRPCLRCSSWLFAKFNHQRFCGKHCQTLHYQTGEYWKQRRRNEYASSLSPRKGRS